MGNISNLFGGDFTPPPPPKEQHHKPPYEQLLDAITAYGYEQPSEIRFDGKIHRFSTTGKKKDDSGWYVAYEGKVCAGAFGDWKDGTAINWRQDLGRELSMAEQIEHASRMKILREAREAEEKARQANTADTVSSIWSNATDATDSHPYLTKKQVKSHGLKVTGDGRLMVPMFDSSGELSSLQYITGEGEKRYHSGGKTKASFYCIAGTGDDVFLAEGYATAATIHETTGATVYVGFSAGQLLPVAEIIKANHTEKLIVIADNDESGTGYIAAKKAADNTGARLVMPPEIGTDANDFVIAGGDLANLIYPPVDDFLIAADDFCSQPAPIRWLIKGYLQREALIMIHGPSGGGKTFVVLDMCCHIASNKVDWCGNKVHGGSVVYLAGEGHHGLRGRLAAWRQSNSVDSLNMWLSKAGTDLNTPEGYEKVVRSINQLPEPPAVIVVDTLHRFLNGDENSAQDTKTMLDACAGLMGLFGCSVVLVHHTGVNEEAQHRARGSSAWRGALEIELSVKPGNDGEAMQIIPRKSKDSELPDVISGRLASVELPWIDEDGEPVTSAVFEFESSAKVEVKETESQFTARQSFEQAFLKSGEIIEGKCYLSESAWRDFYRNQHPEKTSGAITKGFQRTKKALEDAQIIEKKGSVLFCKDVVMASILTVVSNSGWTSGEK